MNNSVYNYAKTRLIGTAQEIKKTTDDKPLIRMTINDTCNDICEDISAQAMHERISEKQSELYQNWLHSLAANLHPKN